MAAVQLHRVWLASNAPADGGTLEHLTIITFVNPSNETAEVRCRFIVHGEVVAQQERTVAPGIVSGCSEDFATGWVLVDATGSILPNGKVIDLREGTARSRSTLVLHPVDCERPAGFEHVCQLVD
jgi:hypothetical protein